jgi:hypothetical protein
MGEDDGMRRIAATAAIALATALVCAAGWPGAGHAQAATPPHVVRSAPRSVAACYAFAVSALRRHVTVRRTPPVCAGLGAAQLNQVIGRAIRTAAGPLHRAAARRQDQAESRYLASLIRQGRAPLPASLKAGLGRAPRTQGARLAALAAWLAAALAGGYLLAGRRRPRSRRWTRGLGLAGGHAGLAVAGLCLWVGFMVTAEPALGWTDVALTWVIVGLGMATLLGGVPDVPAGPVPEPAAPAPSAAPGAPVRTRAPVLVIALHGALATVTMLLVLLAVISAS